MYQQPIKIEEHSIKMWIHRKAPSKTILTRVLSTFYLEQEKFRIIYDINQKTKNHLREYLLGSSGISNSAIKV